MDKKQFQKEDNKEIVTSVRLTKEESNYLKKEKISLGKLVRETIKLLQRGES